MKIYHLIIILLLAVAACGYHGAHDARLLELDSALWRDPDSVCHAADEIDSTSLSQRDRAFLRLLRAEAADKSDRTDTTTATISALLDYYINGDREKELHPRVNYILGRIHVERGQNPKALEYFRKALRSADDEKTDPRLMMCITGQMTQIFSNNKLSRHGVKYSKEMIRYAEIIGDPLLIARSNLHLAVEYRGLNFYDSARFIYEKVAPLFAEIGDPVQTTIFATQLASFYKELGEYAKADSIIRGTELATDPRSRSSVANIIIDLEEKIGKSRDMEQRYLDLLSKSDNIYARKTAARNLARISFDRGDGKQGFEYAERFYLTADSISEMEAASTVAELDELYSQSELAENNLELERGISNLKQNRLFLIIIILCLALALTIILIFWKNNRLKQFNKIDDLKKTLENRKEELNNLLEEHSKRVNEIESKDKELSQKNKELSLKNQEIESKNKEIVLKNQEIEEKEKILRKITSEVNEMEFKNNFVHKNFRGASESELGKLDLFIKKMDPLFYDWMKELQEKMGLSERDFNDTLLIRLRLPLKTCASILNCSEDALSVQRKRMMTKVADKRPGEKWTDYILRFSFKSR